MIREAPTTLRRAFRSLAETPGLVMTAVVLLALGLGAGTTVATLVERLFLAPPPEVFAPEQLVRANRFSRHAPANSWSYPDYAFFRDAVPGALELAAYSAGPRSLTALVGEEPLLTAVGAASGNAWQVLGTRPAHGRFFGPEDDRAGAGEPVAVASDTFFRRALGGNPGALGQSLTVNGHAVTLIGVAPAAFRGVSPIEAVPDLWLPIATFTEVAGIRGTPLVRTEGQTYVWLQVIGRLRPEVSRTAAQAEVEGASAALGKEVPAWAEAGEGVSLLPDVRFPLAAAERLAGMARLLLAAVAAVVAIAAVNLALLLAARTTTRLRGLAIALSLGASRGRLLGELLLESLLLTLAGGGLAFLAAFWTADLAARLFPFTFNLDFHPDHRVLGATLAAVCLVGVGAGLVPAFLAVRASARSILRPVRGEGRRRRGAEALVVVQLALATLLLAGMALFVRSYRTAAAVELGFTAEHRFALPINTAQMGLSGEPRKHALLGLLAELGEAPGVERAALSTLVPFQGMMVDEVGSDLTPPGEWLEADFNYVGPGYFAALGIPLRAGREIEALDGAGGEPSAAVVNELAAERLFPGRSPLGQELRLRDGSRARVVGVVAAVRTHQLDEPPMPYVYLPALAIEAGSVQLILESRAGAARLSPMVAAAVRRLSTKLAVPPLQPLSAAVERTVGPYRVSATLVGFLGGLGLLLAAVGLYGLEAARVGRERRSLGVRLALGATPARLQRWIVGRALALALLGLLPGLTLARLLAPKVGGLLFAISPTDPASFLPVPLLLTAVAALAAVLPARRAAAIQPAETLRAEP